MNRKVLAAGLLLVAPFLALLFANVHRNPQRMDSPLVGKPAPPLDLRPLDGGAALTLDRLRGKPAVLNFWATWCGPCLQEHPVLQQAARVMGEDVRFLGIVYEDGEEDVRAYLDRHGSSYANYLDDGARTAIAYGVYGVPETYVLGPDGTIVDKHVGPLDAATLSALVRRASEQGGRP